MVATGSQSKRQSSLQQISKGELGNYSTKATSAIRRPWLLDNALIFTLVEKRKDSPSSTYLPSTKILSSCDALSSDDDSEEYIAIDSYGDSDIERENRNVVTRCLGSYLNTMAKRY